MGALSALQPEPCDHFAAAQERFADVLAFMRSKEALAMTHSDMERELEVRSREAQRLAFQRATWTSSSAASGCSALVMVPRDSPACIRSTRS